MILAIESSFSVGSVALVDGDRVCRSVRVETPRGRGGAFFGVLEEVLRDVPNLHRVVVGIGPGSYNGIRSAIAAGWGIAAARDVPIVGVSSLLGLGEGDYFTAGDARRGQYFFAHVREGAFVEEPCLLEEAELRGRVGSAAVFTPASVPFLPGAVVVMPDAVRLARIGASREPGMPEPIYLKPAFITAPRAASSGTPAR